MMPLGQMVIQLFRVISVNSVEFSSSYVGTGLIEAASYSRLSWGALLMRVIFAPRFLRLLGGRSWQTRGPYVDLISLVCPCVTYNQTFCFRSVEFCV